MSRPTLGHLAARDALIEALIAEYGFDREHWAALGSANRITMAVLDADQSEGDR